MPHINPDARVLSLHQPWASAIIFGGKDVENRTWTTAHRGRLWIHATRAIDRDEIERADRLVELTGPDPRRYITSQRDGGVILGFVSLVAVGRSDSEWASSPPHLYHWLLRDPVALPIPVKTGGFQNLWRLHKAGLAEVIEDDGSISLRRI